MRYVIQVKKTSKRVEDDDERVIPESNVPAALAIDVG